MKRISVLLWALMLTACVKNVDGTFNAKSDLLLNTKKGQRQVKAGTKPATLKLKSKKKVQLTFFENGEKLKVVFKVPKGIKIPQNRGSLRLRADEVGQPYDIAANIDNEYTSSEPRHGTESCYRTVYRPVRRCTTRVVGQEQRCRRENGRRVCRNVDVTRRVCRTVRESRSVRGYRNITYTITGNSKEFSFKLLDPATQANLGTFKGYEYSSGRDIIDRDLYCRVSGYHYDTGIWIDIH